MALSNNYTDCQVLNLDPDDPRRGPFVVTQNSTDPLDPTQRENMYLLRRDGQWIEYATHALMPAGKRVEIAFDSLAEIVTLMAGLPMEPKVIRDADVSQAELKQFLQGIQAAGGMLAHIRANVARYKAQRK